MVLSTNALFHCLGSRGVGAEINDVAEELKCSKHLGCLIETSPGTPQRGARGQEKLSRELPLGILVGESNTSTPLNRRWWIVVEYPAGKQGCATVCWKKNPKKTRATAMWPLCQRGIRGVVLLWSIIHQNIKSIFYFDRPIWSISLIKREGKEFLGNVAHFPSYGVTGNCTCWEININGPLF